MSEIDPLNDRILSELSRDGRISNVDLAERVGLSPSACLRRVQDLEKRGVIKGYRAVLDRAKLGSELTIFVMVGLAGQLRKDSLAFERAMDAAPEVKECHNITGTVEYLLRIEVEDLATFKDFHSNCSGHTVPSGFYHLPYLPGQFQGFTRLIPHFYRAFIFMLDPVSGDIHHGFNHNQKQQCINRRAERLNHQAAD